MQEEITLDNLFKEVRVAAKRAAVNKPFRQVAPPVSSWAFPDNWRLLKYVTLLALPANTVLGQYEKWQHVKHLDAIRYVKITQELRDCGELEIIRGDLEEARASTFSREFHKHKQLTCKLHPIQLGVKPQFCTVDLHYAYGKLAEVVLQEAAVLVSLAGAGFLSLPAGVNVYPTLSQVNIEELQRELHDN